MANIKKLTLENGETRYRLRYYVGRDASGKQTVKTETFRKMRDAKARDTKVSAMKEEGVRIVLSKETFLEYLSRWLKDQGAADDEVLGEIDHEVRAESDAAARFALDAPYPDPSTVDEHVYA